MYYNPNTKEMLSDQELKNLLNVSFPKTTESIKGWLYIHESIPELEEGRIPVKDSIEIRDGQAIQTYRMEDIPEADSTSGNSYSISAISDRVASLERKFNSLKESVPTAESQQNPFEDISAKVSTLENCIEELAAMVSNLHVFCNNAVNEMKAKD